VPLIAGVGWKVGLGGQVALLGSQKGVVHVTLREPRKRSVLLIPFTIRHILVSLEDPDAFIAAVKEKISGWTA
jgi:hypothetical protein